MVNHPYDIGTGKTWNDPVSFTGTGGSGDPWPDDPGQSGTTLVLPNGGTMTLGDTGGATKRLNIHFKDMTIRTQTQDWSKPASLETNDSGGTDETDVVPTLEWHFDNVRMSNVSIKPHNVDKLWLRNLVWEGQACIRTGPAIAVNCNQWRAVHSIFKSGVIKAEIYHIGYFNRCRIIDTDAEFVSGSDDMNLFTMHSTDCSGLKGNPLASGWPSAVLVDGAKKYDIDGSSPQPNSFKLTAGNEAAELSNGTFFGGSNKGHLPGSVSWSGRDSSTSPYSVDMHVGSGETFHRTDWVLVYPSGLRNIEAHFSWSTTILASFTATYPLETCFAIQLERQFFDGSWVADKHIIELSNQRADPFCPNRLICDLDVSKLNPSCITTVTGGGGSFSVTGPAGFVLTPNPPFIPGSDFGTSTANRIVIYANGVKVGYSNEFTVTWVGKQIVDTFPNTTNYNASYVPERDAIAAALLAGEVC